MSVNLPNVARASDARFDFTPPCGLCIEDDFDAPRVPAVIVVNDDPMCWDHATEELS